MNLAQQRRRSKRRQTTDPTLPLLKQLLSSSRNQQTSGEPDAPDLVIPPYKRDKVYTFRNAYQVNITGSTSVETDGAINFTLNQIPNATPLAQIFDQYRILYIRCQFQPYSENQFGQNIYTVIDYDDSNTISANSMLAYDTLKTAPVGAYFERTFRPCANMALYNGSTFADAGALKSPWVDMAGLNVPHYGIKFAIPSASTANQWGVTCTFTFQCKYSR